MPEFIDPLESPLWPRWLTPFFRPVMKWLLIDDLSDCLARYGEDLNVFVREMEALGGSYTCAGGSLGAPPRPRTVLYANHPLGGAEIIAAIRLLEEARGPYQMLATNVVVPPKGLWPHLIPIDNSDLKGRRNLAALRRLARRFGQADETLFIFPSGHTSVFRLGRGVTDDDWKDTFIRLAAGGDASLTPLWFAGSNSVFFHIFSLMLGPLRPLLLPLEFFRIRHKRLIYRVGRAIPQQALPFFGDQAVEALRASVYLLEDRAPTSAAPDAGDLSSLLASAYDLTHWRGPPIVDIGRVPTGDPATIRARLTDHVVSSRPGTLPVGVVVLDDCDAALAEAQFEFARRSAPCAELAGLKPRSLLIPPSPHHRFNVAAIRYAAPPSPAALSPILRACLEVGLRLGPSSWSLALGGRPCVVAAFQAADGRAGSS